VVVAIIAVLVAMLLPALVSARTAAHATGCSSNLRQISVGVFHYTEDFNLLPTPIKAVDLNGDGVAERWDMWDILLGERYLFSPVHWPRKAADWKSVFTCPADRIERYMYYDIPRSYGMLGWKGSGWYYTYLEIYFRLQNFSMPSQQFLLAEWRWPGNSRGQNWPGAIIGKTYWELGWDPGAPGQSANSIFAAWVPSKGDYHGKQTMNYLFLDSHVERLIRGQAATDIHWVPQ